MKGLDAPLFFALERNLQAGRVLSGSDQQNVILRDCVSRTDRKRHACSKLLRSCIINCNVWKISSTEVCCHSRSLPVMS